MTSNELDFKEYLRLIIKRKLVFVLTALGIMTVAVIVALLQPRLYEAKSTIFIEKSTVSKLVSQLALTPSVANEINFLNSAITSRDLLLKVFADLNIKTDRQNPAQLESMINSFKADTKVKVQSEGDSDGSRGLFIVTYLGDNPKFSSDYVNALVKRYIEENVSIKQEEASGASRFLAEAIKDYKAQLDKAEAALSEFRNSRAGLISTDQAALMSEISSLQQRLDSLATKRRETGPYRGPGRPANPLQEKLSALQRTLAELRMQYTDNYPEVIKVKEQIEEIKSQLSSRNTQYLPPSTVPESGRASMERNSVGAQAASLRRLLASRQAMLREYPAAKAKLDALQKERDARENLYQELVNSQNKSQFTSKLDIQEKAMNFRIIEPAVVPTSPAEHRRLKIILLGIIVGVAAGLGSVILLDRLDNSINTVNALRTLGVPVIAVIPKIENTAMLMVEKRKDLALYIAAGTYFSLIIAVLVMEILNLPYLDNLIGSFRSGPF